MKKVFLFPSVLILFITLQAQQKSGSITAKKVTVFATAENTELRLTENGNIRFEELRQPLETQPVIFVDPSKTFQTVLGIGAALTDASAETFYKLPAETRQQLLRAYFDKKQGIGYTLARTNINSCDFSSDTYTYVADNDASLKTFSLAHDKKFKIPFIKEATAAAGGKLSLYVSPWSPPAWMKDNNNMLQGGKLKPEFRQNWANYYVKFIKGYEALGIPVWGLTVQNEPMAKQRWESCIFTAEEERDFIKQYLGPTLQRSGLSGKKLIAWDHNRDLIYQRATTLLSDPVAARFIWGIGFHWYETWTGGNMQFQNLQKVHEAFPLKNLVFTEGCVEKFERKRIDDWKLGERYGYSMVNDFNQGTVAWTDWNILLDENGGPNHVGNFCFAPVHADTKTGELLFTNAYYYIGHFSKFIQTGAKRITSSSSRDQLSTTAFLNPNGQIVVVVLNLTDQKLPFHLWLKGNGAATESLPHSIMTLVVE